MEVVDKRRETDEWHVGDVICYWNKPDEKYYGLICEIKLPQLMIYSIRLRLIFSILNNLKLRDINRVFT